MAASTNPFVVQGTLSYPPDEGQQQVPIVFGLSGAYTAICDSRLVMSGSGSQDVPFGSVGTPGAKAVLIEYEKADGAGAVNLRFNGGTDNLELAPGGCIMYTSPDPVAGLVSLTIVRTTDATIRVRVLG